MLFMATSNVKRIIGLSFFFIFSATAICIGQTSKEESLTIRTYYPAPTGVYSAITLKPSDNEPSGPALQPGVIYFNNTTNMLRYYNKTKVWVNLTGGSQGSYWEYNATSKEIRNTNTGKVIIYGETDWNLDYTLLTVYGEPRIQGKSGNSTLYLSRNAASDVSTFLEWQTYDVGNRSWIWGARKMAAWPASRLSLSHINNTSIPFYLMTVNENGSIGLRSNATTPFINPSAKLHIQHKVGAVDDYYPTVVTYGNGKIGMELSSASDNATLGPVINGYNANGAFASPAKVNDENILFRVEPEGRYSGSTIEVGSLDVAAHGTWDASSNAVHLHVYGTNTTAKDADQRICVMPSGEIDFNFNSWYDWNLHVCWPGTSCSVWGGVDPAHPDHWSSSSDRRFKKNISGIEDALEKVLRAKGIRYDPVTDASSIEKNGRLFGFIGQDLENVMPELVDVDPQGYRSVSYDGITPVLVEAIKDQQKQIESLRQEVEALRARKKQGSI
jgi:hypothetical protein